MADLDGKANAGATNDWILGNPWLWMGTGLLCAGMALVLLKMNPGAPTFFAFDKYSVGVISKSELQGTPWFDQFAKIDNTKEEQAQAASTLGLLGSPMAPGSLLAAFALIPGRSTTQDRLIDRVEFDSVVPQQTSPGRFILVALSLLFVGIGLHLRLRSNIPNYLEPTFTRLQAPLLLGVGGFHCLLAVGVTALLGASVLGIEAISWKSGHLIVLWFVLVPMSATAAGVCFQRLKTGGPISKGEEGSALLTLTALVCFVNYWALFRTPAPEEADTLRTFLAGAILAAIVAAPLAAVQPPVRRAVISGLVLLHFGGIATAALSAPPSPTIMVQLWTRIYRPYLEFIYMNNAYHFYAPEPGPASYLWFRLTYIDGDNPESSLHYYHWVKIPDIDEKGSPRYPVALEYQRVLALTENTVSGSYPTTFSTLELDVATGQVISKPMSFYENRWKAARDNKVAILGNRPAPVSIPFHPNIPELQQYFRPLLLIENILKSYARHVARTPSPDPDRPNLKVHRVKIYKVTHLLPWPPEKYIFGKDIREPDNYNVYYMGEFTPEGKLIGNDPFLYWMMPTIRIYDLAKVTFDPRDTPRAREAWSGRGLLLNYSKDTLIVPAEALEHFKNHNIKFQEAASVPVLKSYVHVHARDRNSYYLMDEKKWMSDE